MKYRWLLFAVCAALLSVPGFAQDSLVFFGHGALRITGGHYYITNFIDKTIRLPDYQDELWLWRSTDGPIATDNPLLHGASYLDIDGRFQVVPGFTVHANLVAEHRGFSYGVYPANNMIVYPKLNIAADTAVDVLGQRFYLHASTGNVTDGRLYEGLAIYNIDWQGTIFSVKWKYFKLQYHKIGDLEYGIGLGLNDADDFMLMAEELPLGAGWYADVKAGTYFRPSTGYYLLYPGESSGFGNTVSLGVYPSDNFRLYAQYGLRKQRTGYPGNGGDFSAYLFSAYLVGAYVHTALGPLNVTARSEYRHYSARYNDGFSSYTRSQYHDYPSSIGDFLYPVSCYTRPFSQWAVFTDYLAEDVDGATLYLETILHLPLHLVFYGMADLDYIMPGDVFYEGIPRREDFLWAFYEGGIGWSPRDNILLRWTYGNKGMNLERNYMTFYMYREPAMKLTAEYTFPVVAW